MREFTEEFENKECTITRKEYGELAAREIYEVTKAVDDACLGAILMELMAHFSAAVMAEMFGTGNENDDVLEVE